MFRKKRYLFLTVIGTCLLVGIYLRKIRNTGTSFFRESEQELEESDLDFTVFVGEYLITREEVKWEYDLYIAQMLAPESASSAEARPLDGEPPSPPATSKAPIMELYNKILADLIERKLLYQYLAKDERFTLKDPSRYTNCIENWKLSTERLAKDLPSEKDREHLKSMLCEKDIILQYVKERINSGVQISDAEAQTYFNEHKSEFIEPQRAVIRQIVLGSEDDAKKVRARVTSANFSKMAEELSIAPEAKQGGRLGPYAKGELPNVFDVAFEMKPGAIEGILKSTYGFHILMLEKKLPRVELSFEAAKSRITQTLAEKRQEEEYKKWVETALNSIPIKSSRAF